MQFSYQNNGYRCELLKSKKGRKIDKFAYQVTKIGTHTWPGENGEMPPASFLETMHDGEITEGKMYKELDNGMTRCYVIEVDK